jgi:hypothetical protein
VSAASKAKWVACQLFAHGGHCRLGTEIKLSLTQEEIAHMVGTTRQPALRLEHLLALDIVWFGRGCLVRNAEALSRSD